MIDTQTVIGLIIGVAAVVGGMALKGGDPAALAHGGAFLIVVGGTVAAVLVQTPGNISLHALSMLVWLVRPPKPDSRALVERVVAWNRLAHRDGRLALERVADRQTDSLTRNGLLMLADGCGEGVVRSTLETQLAAREDYQLRGARVFEAAGGYAPTIGILGAVLGLIQVMGNLDDPEGLGAGIAVAFVATVYGLAAANLVLLPIANKLKYHIDREVKDQEMLIDGLTGIAAGKGSRELEYQLNGHIE